MNAHFKISNEVQNCLDQKKPVLALESTLFTHGLPYPSNFQLAEEIIDITKAQNVLPAIISIINGKIVIGTELKDLESLITETNVLKATSANLPYILSNKRSAATTVASTLYCANKVGIEVFATGGIGGVHRGEEQDVSADLYEMAKTRMCVVCSGAKAILDLPKTMEYLESLSIPVIGYKTEYFPAFYTAKSHLKLNMDVGSLENLTDLLLMHWSLGLPSSVLVVNPIPIEDEIAIKKISQSIDRALKTAKLKSITGNKVTPFLLKELEKNTNGESLKANMALIKNNVKLGAEIAKNFTVKKYAT